MKTFLQDFIKRDPKVLIRPVKEKSLLRPFYPYHHWDEGRSQYQNRQVTLEAYQAPAHVQGHIVKGKGRYFSNGTGKELAAGHPG